MEQILSSHMVNISELKARTAKMVGWVSQGPLAVLSHNEVKAYLVSKELLEEYQALKFAQKMDRLDVELTTGKGVKVEKSKNGKINYFGS